MTALLQMIAKKPRLGLHISALATRVLHHDLGVYTQREKLAKGFLILMDQRAPY